MGLHKRKKKKEEENGSEDEDRKEKSQNEKVFNFKFWISTFLFSLQFIKKEIVGAGIHFSSNSNSLAPHSFSFLFFFNSVHLSFPFAVEEDNRKGSNVR